MFEPLKSDFESVTKYVVSLNTCGRSTVQCLGRISSEIQDFFSGIQTMIESCKKHFHGFKINYNGFKPLLQVSSLQGFKHITQNETQGEKCQNAYFETLFNPKVESLIDVLYLLRNPAKTLYSVSPTHFQRYKIISQS